MRLAWVFPGQGSVRTGCVRAAERASVPTSDQRAAAAAARTAIDTVAAATGLDVRRLGDDVAVGGRTADAQPTILAASLAAAAALRASGVRPDVVAGHSLGECTAAAAAGVLTSGEAARTVAARGRAMGRACAATPGAMAAVVQLAPAAVEDLLARHPRVVVANDNAPGQVVVAGPPEAIAQVRRSARALGGRAVPLDVEGAFHSTAMAAARPDLAAAVARTRPRDPEVPLFTAVDASLATSGEAAAAALVDGLLAPVRWRETQLALARAGVRVLVEVGPGGILAGLAARTLPDVEVHRVATPADAVAVAHHLGLVGARP